MKIIQNCWIKLKNTIDHEDYDLINTLQEQCSDEDKTALKLELDYKRGLTLENGEISILNDNYEKKANKKQIGNEGEVYL